MKLTGNDIRNQEFPVKLRGYDRLDVDAFLQTLGDFVDEMNRRNAEWEQSHSELVEKIREMEKRDQTLQRTLIAVNELREESDERASRMLEGAERRAKEVTEGAENAALSIRNESEREAERLRREMAEIVDLRERILRDLSEVLRAQTRLIEGESRRMGVDLERILGEESGKIVNLNQKAEGERP